jgi:four helix bundle protein
LWSIATIRTFFASNTRTQFAWFSSSAFVGESPATLALVNFTPRGCRMELVDGSSLMVDGWRELPHPWPEPQYHTPMFNFENLEVWQKAIDFADLVYSLTRHFPAEERFGLTNQMRRAAVSISSNIAEGSARISHADFARFVEIATGSLFEVVSQSTIGLRQNFLTQAQYTQIYAAAEQQGKMLSGLRRSLVER